MNPKASRMTKRILLITQFPFPSIHVCRKSPLWVEPPWAPKLWPHHMAISRYDMLSKKSSVWRMKIIHTIGRKQLPETIKNMGFICQAAHWKLFSWIAWPWSIRGLHPRDGCYISLQGRDMRDAGEDIKDQFFPTFKSYNSIILPAESYCYWYIPLQH